MVKNKISGIFPAFSHRNYRLFWFGQCISLIGTWMQTIGQSWLVLQMTKSAFKLGLINAVQFLPMMLFALFAGTLVDRFPKRTVLIITQTSLAILSAVLATLTIFNVVQYWHVLVLAALLGIVNTLDMPTRQSFFVELVGKEDLMNAIALNSTIFNLARILGPAVAGILIGAVGIGICFYLNALSFLAVIIGLSLMKVTPNVKAVVRQSIKGMFKEIGEGLAYIRHRTLLLMPLLLLAVTSAFVMNFSTLVPVFATENLGQGATGYGFMMTSMGIGSFVGALVIAAASKAGPRLKYMLAGAAGMSLLMVLLGLAGSFSVACITLLVLGFCAIVFTTLVNTTIQLNSEDSMRGRVMSVYSLVFGGVMPIGGLYAGKLTAVAGAPVSMFISGAIGIAAAGFAIIMLWGKRKRREL
jgi:MFS family permease